MTKNINSKIKVKCIEYTVKNNNQGMYAIYITPLPYIIKEYGSVDCFIEQRQEGHSRGIQEIKEVYTSDYSDSYNEYVNNHYTYIEKSIEAVKNCNTIQDKEDVLKYLKSLL